MPTHLCLTFSLMLLLGLSLSALGQTTPFFNRGVFAYEPEISTVTTGDQIVTAPTVSHDRKYVTIGGQFQSSRVLRIETIPFATTTIGGTAPAGLIGGARPAAVSPGNADNLNLSRPAALRAGAGGTILGEAGMTRIGSAPSPASAGR